MKIKSVPTYPLVVKFLDPYQEKQELQLEALCMTPKQYIEFTKKSTEVKVDFHQQVKLNCEAVGDWSGVVDEAGKEVPFSKEKFADVQYDYFGLADAVTAKLIYEGREQRKKRSLLLENIEEPQSQGNPSKS